LQVFKTLVLGGAMCQPEDTVAPYLDVAKRVYKDCVCVYRSRDDAPGAITIASQAYLIRSVVWASAGVRLWSSASAHNVCIVVVSAARGQAVVLHKTHRSFW
jgi:Domain of unknown function (DUF4498)